jgi:hypothetical protein
MLYAYLVQGNAGALLRAATFAAADPSEKSAISYSLGMTMAKLFAEVLFDTPRLLHYAVYAPNYEIAVAAGNSRPDLIGRTTTGGWIVFEAKGRSNGLDKKALGAAKLQAKQIYTIENSVPLCHIGGQSYFSPGGLKFMMDDPEPADNERSRRLNISAEELVVTYDRSLRRLVESRGEARRVQIEGVDFTEAPVEEADIVLGLPEGDAAPQVARRPRQISPTTYIGGDGLLVRLGNSWSEDRMRLEPHLR